MSICVLLWTDFQHVRFPPRRSRRLNSKRLLSKSSTSLNIPVKTILVLAHKWNKILQAGAECVVPVVLSRHRRQFQTCRDLPHFNRHRDQQMVNLVGRKTSLKSLRHRWHISNRSTKRTWTTSVSTSAKFKCQKKL